jgi:hypothetical protein
MESKQTAVEWMAEKVGHNSLMSLADYNEILEQAKAMEKEQIMDAHEKPYIDMNLSFRSADRAEEYYNDTYKK